MIDILSLKISNGVLAFGLTFLAHSTAWFLVMWLILRLPSFQHAASRNFLLKAACIGSIFTSIFAFNGQELTLSSNVYEEKIAQNDRFQLSSFLLSYLDSAPLDDNEAIIPDEQASSASSTQSNWGFSIPSTLIGIWILGFMFFFCKALFQHLRFMKGIGKREDLDDPVVDDILSHILDRIGRTIPIRLTQAKYLPSPVVIAPHEICLPFDCHKKLPYKHMEALLAHEVAHIVRKDHTWAFFMLFLRAVFFFQPFLYWVEREVRKNNECLCDAWAANNTNDPFTMAQCLLSIAHWLKSQHQGPWVAGMALQRSELSHRVHLLIQTDMKTRKIHPMIMGGILCAILIMNTGFVPQFNLQASADKLSSEVIVDDTILQEELMTVPEQSSILIPTTEPDRVMATVQVENEPVEMEIDPIPIKNLKKGRSLASVSVMPTVLKKSHALSAKPVVPKPIAVLDTPKKKHEASITINAKHKSDPLFVVDGEIIETKNKREKRKYIDNLDPNSIATINILKGASAHDKYGDKGKNGVVEIRTKKKGKAKGSVIVNTSEKDDAVSYMTISEGSQSGSYFIQLKLKKKAQVKVELINESSEVIEVIEDKQMDKGSHTIEWNTSKSSLSDIGGKTYIVKFSIDGKKQSSHVILAH